MFQISEIAMTERPILFSAAMVSAILADAKTMTRRAVKPQPPDAFPFAGFTVESSCAADTGTFTWRDQKDVPLATLGHRARCPFGHPGDRLYVRETWSPADILLDGYTKDDPTTIAYRADLSAYSVEGCPQSPPMKLDSRNWNFGKLTWKRAIHMPRWASRITLEVTEVRVERLQAISDDDAEQEGCAIGVHAFDCHGLYDCDCGSSSYRETFERLWKSINGADSWDANPWVWAVSFRRATP